MQNSMIRDLKNKKSSEKKEGKRRSEKDQEIGAFLDNFFSAKGGK